MKAKQILLHPEWNFRTKDYDFALLTLEEPVQFNAHIQVHELLLYVSLTW